MTSTNKHDEMWQEVLARMARAAARPPLRGGIPGVETMAAPPDPFRRTSKTGGRISEGASRAA